MKFTRHWFFGINSLWCKITKRCYHRKVRYYVCPETRLLANQWCPASWMTSRKIDKPTAVCAIHKPAPPPPPPKPTEEYEVCMRSWGLPNDLCIHTTKRSMINPPAVCDIERHTIPTYPDPHAQMAADFLGSFNGLKIRGWKKEDRWQAEDEYLELVREIPRYGFSKHKSFLFLSSGKPEHENQSYKTPWYWNGHEFDLAQKDPTFWGFVRRDLEFHKLVGLRRVYEIFMRQSYVNLPFTLNKNGVKDGLFDPAARKYVIRLAQWLMEEYREVYGPDYIPEVKIANEMSHGGNPDKLHRIMYFHEDVYQKALRPYIPVKHLKNVICDLTGCEGSGGELRGRHKCSKAANCDRGGWHGHKGWPRSNTERHKICAPKDYRELVPTKKWNKSKKIWEDVMKERVIVYLNSANKYRRFTEDGGSRTNSGRIQVRPGMTLADKDQIWDMILYVGRLAKQKGKPEAIEMGFFPHHALTKRGGIFVPDYRKSVVFNKLHAERYRTAQRAWDRVKK